MTSQRMKPRAMSEWIVAAASSAVWPLRSVQARVSLSPAVKNVIRPSASFSRRDDLVERRRPVAELRRLLVGQLGELGLELAVDPAGPFSTASSGFVVSGSSSAGSSPGQSASGCPASRCASSARQRRRARARLAASPDFACFATRSSRRSTWSRSATSSSSRERLEIARRDRRHPRSRRARRGSRRPGGGCRAAGPVPGTSTTRIAAGVTFFARDEPRAGRGARRRSSPSRRSACRSPTRRR